MTTDYQEPAETPTVVIEPRGGWRIVDWQEIVEYRDLFLFLIWRQIRGRYAQSALGISWAIIQPLVMVGVFTVVFGNLAEIESDGVPYAIFSFAAMTPWTYFQNALQGATESLVGQANMVAKIYFPRMMLPISAVLARLVDFTIALLILGGFLVWYQMVPNWTALFLPFLIILMMMSAAGVGMFLTAMAIQFRDIKHAMTFAVRLLMYLAPVVYPVSLIPEQYRLIYALNPMVGVIEGFRASLLSTTPMPWDLIGVGAVSGIFIFLGGAMYFKRMERVFADVA